MATYNLLYNKDDSIIRHIIIGLLADLNSKLSISRQLTNNKRIVIDVPFYYAVSGDDNFMRDNFLFSTLNGENCDIDQGKADGNYDRVPRGIVNLTSFAVDPAKLVNKRNLGQYNRINPNNGMLESYVAEFEMIPVVIGVDVEIIVSSQLDIFKVTEAIIKKMYKANSYQVDAGHLEDGTYRISSEYSMPDDYTQERPIEYGFEDKTLNNKVTFSLEINSFMPSFDFEEDVCQTIQLIKTTCGWTGNLEDPTDFITPNIEDYNSDIIYYSEDYLKLWKFINSDWVLTHTGQDAIDEAASSILECDQLGIETYERCITKRRKASNRMTLLGNSDLIINDNEDGKSALGDLYNVTSKDLPFAENDTDSIDTKLRDIDQASPSSPNSNY